MLLDPNKAIIPQDELNRLQEMMPTRFGSLGDLPSAQELADLSDEDLFYST